MNLNRDILEIILVRCDVETIRSISKTTLWNDVRDIMNTSHFWFLRTQQLVSVELDHSDTDSWKNTFYILTRALKNDDPFPIIDTSSPTALKIVFQIGYRLAESRDDLLCRIAQEGHTDTLKILISLGYEVPEPDDLLVLAIQNDRVELAKFLLAECNIDPTDSWIHYAIECHSIDIVRLLLLDPRIDSRSLDENGDSALTMACYMRDRSIVELILADERVTLHGIEGALILVIEIQSIEIIKFLLSREEIVNHLIASNWMEGDIMRIAILSKNIEIVELLLAQTDITLPYDPTNIAMGGPIEIMKLIIERQRR